MLDANGDFLTSRRLLSGPWQQFERDVARLMLHAGFEDVRIVGGSGDHGGDVLGAKRDEVWVWQVKHTTTSGPPREAVEEVAGAARYYGARRIVVATSRPATPAFTEELARFAGLGYKVEHVGPTALKQLARQVPELCPRHLTPRPYQEQAAYLFRRALTDAGRAQMVLATGLGKTLVMAEAVSGLLSDGLVAGDRVLVLAHTRDLVSQLHASFWPQLPKWVPTHQLAEGEWPTFWEGITFATIQSVCAHLERLPSFGLVLVDEAHHLGSNQFQAAITELDPPMLGGVTATPWRGDGYDIDVLLGTPVFRMGIAEGLLQGFLAEVDYRLLADNLDWEAIQQLSANRYSLSQLNKRLIIPIRDDQAVRLILNVRDREQRKAGIVFCPSIEHAEEIAATCRRYGIRTEAVSASLPPRERDNIMARFRVGDLDMVTTVDLFNEGVDVPDVDLIVFMRATHSRRIFVQQLGRGLRMRPGKEKVVVLDFVTDIRRVAEVVELDQAVRTGSVERLRLGDQLIAFNDISAGGFLREWILDQADLIRREGDPQLDLPRMEFPPPHTLGTVQ